MSETTIIQNIKGSEGRCCFLMQFYLKAHYKQTRSKGKNWSYEGKVAASVLFLAESGQ